MDRVINSVIDIDKKALKIKEDTEKLLNNNNTFLKKELESLEKYEISKAKKLGEREYQKLIDEGTKKAEIIILEGEKEYRDLEDKFKKRKKQLVDIIIFSILSQ